MRRFGPIAALLGLLALNGLAASMGLRGYDAYASRHWAEVTGRVVASGVTPVDGSDEWLATVEYQYAAPGGARRGRVLTFDAPAGGRRYDSQVIAARVANAYPVGRRVKVYFDPEAPDRAVLERAGAFRLVGVGTLMVTAAVFSNLLAAAYVWRARRHRQGGAG